jgi:hypothetical protein
MTKVEKKGISRLLREAVIAALKKEFDLPIYGEKQTGKAKKPCFTVELSKVWQTKLLGERNIESYSFIIGYLPKEGNEVRMELQETAERMYDALFMIEQDGESFAPCSMKYEIKDGQVFFTVEYQVHIIRKKEYETMGTLTLNGRKEVGFGENGEV